MRVLVRRRTAGPLRYLRVPLDADLARRFDAVKAVAEQAGFDLPMERLLVEHLMAVIDAAERELATARSSHNALPRGDALDPPADAGAPAA